MQGVGEFWGAGCRGFLGCTTLIGVQGAGAQGAGEGDMQGYGAGGGVQDAGCRGIRGAGGRVQGGAGVPLGLEPPSLAAALPPTHLTPKGSVTTPYAPGFPYKQQMKSDR